MALVPLCKTAIITFLVNEDTIQKLWNLSSNMRKRLQMVLKQMEITLKEYNSKALKIKEWVKIIKYSQFVKSAKEIKKGVSNYCIQTPEQLDRVLSLNGKLRCGELNLFFDSFLEFDWNEEIKINSWNYAFYSRCSFNRIGLLSLIGHSTIQIKETLSRINQIRQVKINSCSISNLDLSAVKFASVSFKNVIFSGEVKLPYKLECLEINCCCNSHFLRCNRVNEVNIHRHMTEESFEWVKSLKGVKRANIARLFSECSQYLPSTVRILGDSIDFETNELSSLKDKFPFLIKIESPIPIEDAETLNLKGINPIISETEEKFTFRPKEITVNRKNVEQLNKHSELFEGVEKVKIDTNKFNYDCLPGKIKQLQAKIMVAEEKELENLKKNSWKFESSVIDLGSVRNDLILRILSLFKRKLKVNIY